MERDHPMLVQHSRHHTQGWRANGDISIILSKISPDNQFVDDKIATKKYVCGYACKGNEPTGAVAEIFIDILSSANDDDASALSVFTKLLMKTVKRYILTVGASFEISGLPIYRCSHQFQKILHDRLTSS